MIIKDVLFVKEILKKHFAEAGYCLAISVFITNIEPEMVFVYIVTTFILQGVYDYVYHYAGRGKSTKGNKVDFCKPCGKSQPACSGTN